MLASTILPALSTRWWLKLISPLADIEPMMGGRIPGRSLALIKPPADLAAFEVDLEVQFWSSSNAALARSTTNQPNSVNLLTQSEPG